MTVRFRVAAPDDRAFIVDSWVEGYRHCHAAGLIPMPHYQRVYREACNWMLDRPGVTVTIAESDGTLLGWIAVEQGVVVPTHHRDGGKWQDSLEPANCPMVLYAFVKDPYRRHGIGRALFAAGGVDLASPFLYASKTPTSDRLRDKAPFAKWNPLAARFAKKG